MNNPSQEDKEASANRLSLHPLLMDFEFENNLLVNNVEDEEQVVCKTN